jgi:hypothetical protein
MKPLTMLEEKERVARMDTEAPHASVLLTEIDALRAVVKEQREVILAGFAFAAATLVYSYEELEEQRSDFEARALKLLRGGK